ncbi:MAG: LysR substrate-binding domain-containing protein [Rhodobacterales bacterium]|nr:LysR substrate-binding domain-containing protein [Rhodobacterales bacterium]
MRLEWLEDILAIESTGSFSGAAEQRHLTQSAFSRRIQQIEQHIGVTLFDRSQKPVQLRAITLAQSGQIELICSQMRQLVVDLRRGDRIAGNKIVIASQHSLTTSLMPSIVHGMQHKDGGVHVRLRSANLDECFGLLLSRQADVAIVYHLEDAPDAPTEDFLETIEIGRDCLIPVCSADLALRFIGSVADRELPLIEYPQDVFFGGVMATRITPALASGIIPVARAETALTLAALEMAASGVGVAWVPASVARRHVECGWIVDLSAHLPSCDLLVQAVRLGSKHSPAVSALWTLLHARGDQNSGE